MKNFNYCYNKDLYIGYPIGAIKTIDDLYSDNKCDYTYYYAKVNENNKENITIKPKGKYLIGYVKDSYTNVNIFYSSLLYKRE